MELRSWYEFIRQNKFAILSTVSKNNSPQSACVGIAVTPELKLIFDTTTDSRKYQNLIHNSSVSFVIGWEQGKTMQYEGIAKHLDKQIPGDWLAIYYEMFPDGIERNNNNGNITYFLVEPKWIRFSDFNPLPPEIEEMHF
jgi:general stress protein 26